MGAVYEAVTGFHSAIATSVSQKKHVNDDALCVTAVIWYHVFASCSLGNAVHGGQIQQATQTRQDMILKLQQPSA